MKSTGCWTSEKLTPIKLDIVQNIYYDADMNIGFNTDIKYRDEVFHIQTEDKGKDNPTLETLVYHSGEILLSRRISYAHLINKPDPKKKIQTMMKNQHDQVISELKDGKFLHLLSMDTQVIDDRGLNELVLDYMGHEESSDSE